MTAIEFDSLFGKLLENKVFVITGGATGIGAALVSKLAALSACVVFGDVNVAAATALLSTLNPDKVHFSQCDVRVYADQLRLFQLAVSKYGRVDHAVANAGIVERGNWFDPEQTLEDVQHEPDAVVIDVNLKGVLYFSRIAAVYMRHQKRTEDDKSLLLVSSAAGFIESRNLPLYQASKHGILGLLRTLRLHLPAKFEGIRVNAICPSLTRTRMVADIEKKWMEAGLPVNEPEDIADIVIGVAVASPGHSDRMLLRRQDIEGLDSKLLVNTGAIDWASTGQHGGLNGRSLYIEGGRVWDIEEGLDMTRELWLGKDPTKSLMDIQAYLKAVGQRKR